MKKLLLLGTIFVASGVLAFGGHGSGRKSTTYQESTTYQGGVNTIGVHMGSHPKGELRVECPEHSETVNGLCQCVEGYDMYRI